MTTEATTTETTDAQPRPAVAGQVERSVRPVPAVAVRVYRVQDADGRGPFRPGLSCWWVQPRPDHQHLVPWMQEFGPEALHRVPQQFGKHFGCACRTLGQLRRWFSAGEYATLRKLGFEAVALEADRVLHESQIQLLFQRRKPLRAGVEPVHLYGPNAQVKPARCAGSA